MKNFILDFKLKILLHYIYDKINLTIEKENKINNDFSIASIKDISNAVRIRNERLEKLCAEKNCNRIFFKKRIETLAFCLEKGKRITLDDNILDDLIFEKIYFDDGSIAKIPVWTGDFLQNIDLSHISFEDVFWGYDEYCKCSGEENNLVNYIKFSGTNAVIDFKKSFEVKIGLSTLCLRNCYFRGIDLTCSHIAEVVNLMENCDLRETGIDFENSNIELINCEIDRKNKALVKNKPNT